MKREMRLATRWLLVLMLTSGIASAAEEIKPGWNLFTPEQDVQLGNEAAQKIEQDVKLVDDPELTEYVSGIGQRLAQTAPGQDYPYTFKVVADPSINAFALPGGPIYIHTGLITAAENEAQLAGVVAHEIGHVALRHSTHQASKQYAFQIPLVLATSALGNSGGLLGALGQLGIGFGVNSLFLKYSRDAEKQSDILGARMMSSVGYDPVEMANFFQKLQEAGGGGMPQFFSSHPNPGNRVNYVSEEVRQLPDRNYTKGNQSQFERMKQRAARVKVPEKKQSSEAGEPGAAPKPSGAEAAQGPLRVYDGAGYRLSYPRDWKVHESNQGAAVTIAPEEGLVRQQRGGPAMALGLMAGFFDSGRRSLSDAADALIDDLRSSNPEMVVVRGQRTRTRLDGRTAESILLTGPSPLGDQNELVWLVAAQYNGRLFYMLLVSPEKEYNALRGRFTEIVRAVKFDG